MSFFDFILSGTRSAQNSAAFWQSLTMGLGIAAGLVWYRRTGWSCGGLVTPGLLALHSAMPEEIFFCLATGLVLSPVLKFISRAFGLYGRERIGAAMLLALAARLILMALSPLVPLPAGTGGPAFMSLWIGWAVPGLIAADMERQGALMTLCGAVSCTAAVVFLIDLLRT